MPPAAATERACRGAGPPGAGPRCQPRRARHGWGDARTAARAAAARARRRSEHERQRQRQRHRGSLRERDRHQRTKREWTGRACWREARRRHEGCRETQAGTCRRGPHSSRRPAQAAEVGGIVRIRQAPAIAGAGRSGRARASRSAPEAHARPVRTGPTARGALRHPAPCVREPRRHRRRWGAGALGGARHTRRCARGRGLPPGHRRPDAPRRGRRRARRHSAADCSLLCVRLPCVASSGRRGERRLAMGVASLRLVPADRPRRGHTAGLGPLAAHGGAGGGWTPRGGADRRHAAPSASELPGPSLARGRAVRRLHDRGAGGHDRGATGTCRPRAGRGEAGRHQAVRSTLEQRHRDEGATAGAWVAEPPSSGRCARAIGPGARAGGRATWLPR